MAGEGDTAVFVFEGRSRTNSLRTPDEFEAQLSRILPLKGQNPPGALCLPLPKSYRLSDERPSGYHSLLLRRKMSAVSPSPGRLSPGRKTPPRVSAPSAGLRTLNVSRVKCGSGPCRGRSAPGTDRGRCAKTSA